jgi:hypothetical protein
VSGVEILILCITLCQLSRLIVLILLRQLIPMIALCFTEGLQVQAHAAVKKGGPKRCQRAVPRKFYRPGGEPPNLGVSLLLELRKLA